jgi:hypothetical protein
MSDADSDGSRFKNSTSAEVIGLDEEDSDDEQEVEIRVCFSQLNQVVSL